VEHGHRVGGEELAVAADAVQADADVLGGVVGDERVEMETSVKARVEGAIAAQAEAVVELGEADQDEGEECPAIPIVVQEDVEVVELQGVGPWQCDPGRATVRVALGPGAVRGGSRKGV